ncbi:MAG: hypothetical protein H6625_02205 [Bdellovibrionaceae bacterium]|nr:hypothetical protein [Pseudobdellovibrionaceae bacterium]
MKDHNKAVLQLKEYSNICLATSRWSIQRNKEKMKTEIENCDNGFEICLLKLAQKWLEILGKKNQDYRFISLNVSEEAFLYIWRIIKTLKKEIRLASHWHSYSLKEKNIVNPLKIMNL